MIQSINPATGQLLRSFEPLTPEAIEQKLALAAHAANTYPSETLDQRRLWMHRLAALLEEDIEELSALMTTEMGKTLASARLEVKKCATGCRYYAENAGRILAPEVVTREIAGSQERGGSPGPVNSSEPANSRDPVNSPEPAYSLDPKKDPEGTDRRRPGDNPEPVNSPEPAYCYVRWDPLGVILAVMPWNFPLWQVFRFLAPALMAGNVGLLKHASNVPQCALAIEALVRRAGFPDGVFQTLLIEARQVESVLADERIAAVTVTGSEAAGRAVAAQAGWLIKKTVLELGGCDPFIVLPSANLEAAVANAVSARCINNGQSCIAAKRFLIHQDLYDEFERRFVAGMEALKVGDPMLHTTDVGPLATPQIVRELLSQVDAAKAAGGCLLTGGNAISGPGNYFQPTVIAGVPRSAAICREETFGPVALLFAVTSVEDAIELANDTPFGLGASVWTNQPAEAQCLATALRCGGVFFNTTVASDPRLPFGGVKKSGYGRELSAAGMREFLNAKTVVVAGSA